MRTTIYKYAVAALCATATFLPSAADCNISLGVANVKQSEEVPEATENYLNTRLQTLLSNYDIATDPGLSQFFIAGKFSHILEDVVAGPPMQTAIHTTLTLYIGDASSENVYASLPLELRGVGTSTQRAYINALRGLNAQNSKITSFIRKGKDKIVNYYDQNYPAILAKAERAAAAHNYDEALWHLSVIPECCTGYHQVLAMTNKYFQNYIDQDGLEILNRATAIWAAQPDQFGAEEALKWLQQIDPESKAYPAAQKLVAEMKASVKSDRDFELRQKYNDAISLEKARIDGARQVGVAFGNGQKQTTTNLMWLK